MKPGHEREILERTVHAIADRAFILRVSTAPRDVTFTSWLGLSQAGLERSAPWLSGPLTGGRRGMRSKGNDVAMGVAACALLYIAVMVPLRLRSIAEAL